MKHSFKLPYEEPYAFRQRLREVHRPQRRNKSLQPLPNELVLDETFDILLPEDAGPVLLQAAHDLQDYLFTSMMIPLRIRRVAEVAAAVNQEDSACILLATASHLPDRDLAEGDGPRGFRIDCDHQVIITGFDEAGVMQGCFFLEDLMNQREAPYLRQTAYCHRPLFSPRMIHSGYALDVYPKDYLARVAHAGYDTILVFVKGPNMTPSGYLDLNELCRIAALYGISVYAYSYMSSEKHPDEPDAADYYDALYGSVFAACPQLKGVVLVGESVEFPSRDPRTTGRSYRIPEPDGLPKTKPSPGWWPCSDYPKWLEQVKRAVRRYNPDADIVFWTYNWGYVDADERLALIDLLPTDISLLVTFEMFEKIQTGPVVSTCVDYTLMFAGPGQYFLSEAKRAKERGIPLYAMVNTGGLTWDIGVIPFEPAPQQWMKRHEAILACRERFGLCGLMESHHYGFWPSFISDLTKWTFWAGTPEPDILLRHLAAREFGASRVDQTLKAWALWSKGIRHCLPTNEDQYGPFRIGPAYPLVLKNPVRIPESPYAHFGARICNLNYAPADSGRSSLFSMRLPVEIAYLTVMRDCFSEGADLLAELLPDLPAHQLDTSKRLVNLGYYISLCAQTTIHVKQWYQKKQQLLAAKEAETVCCLVREMTLLAEAEIKNAEKAIELVKQDSRLGWEPTMEYLGDEAHLRWKIRQVRLVIEHELPVFLSALHVKADRPEPTGEEKIADEVICWPD